MKKLMDDFERDFAEAMQGSVLPMDEVMRYVVEGRGKRLRPQLVFLCARLFGEVDERTRRVALFAELLHTATLIHDDVVDDSVERRHRPSVNARYGNLTAVLAGDYLLSKAMLLLSEPDEHRLLKTMLQAAMAMSEGELLQARPASAEELSSTAYLEVIERKTAQLIRACCLGGAMAVLGEKTEDRSQKLELVGEFGLNLGLAFQMRDDLLDADSPENVALAERLLPLYLDKTLQTLDALAPMVENHEAWVQLRELAVFCATRNQ